MNNKTNYVDVIRCIAHYAANNLNMNLWRDEKGNRTVSDSEIDLQENLDKLGEMRFDRDLGGDSLDLIELVMELEEEFNIEISEGAVETLGADPTVGALSELVVSLSK